MSKKELLIQRFESCLIDLTSTRTKTENEELEQTIVECQHVIDHLKSLPMSVFDKIPLNDLQF